MTKGPRISDLGPYPDEPGYDLARDLDRADPLADFVSRFVAADPDLIYLDGNSLGRLPVATRRLVQDTVDQQWGEDLIRSWPTRWWRLTERIGAKVAGIIGAAPDAVVVGDSTSVNLFKLTVAALQARRGRPGVVTDDLNFPSDNYVLDGAIRMLESGHRLQVIPSADGVHGPAEAIEAALDESTALLSLSEVAFKTGYRYDIADLTEAAHDAGALVLWDLCHSVGVVPLDLDAWGVDLAVGCTYKYLNSGPGAPAFLYVNPALGGDLENPITGWWGHRDPFAFDLDFTPDPSVRRFLSGTLPILSLAPVEVGVDITAEAGVEAIRDKSVLLTSYLIDLWAELLEPRGFSLRSPRDPGRRGAHISLGHPDGWQVAQGMIHDAAVIPDFREPDTIRFGLAPLYVSFEDVHTAVHRTVRVVDAGLQSAYPTKRVVVT